MLTIYPACFFEEEGAYSVVFPDLDNLSTFGEDVDTAMKMAINSLANEVNDRKREGKELPAASAITAVDPDKVAKKLGFQHKGAFVNLVPVDANMHEAIHSEAVMEEFLRFLNR